MCTCSQEDSVERRVTEIFKFPPKYIWTGVFGRKGEMGISKVGLLFDRRGG